MNYTSLLKFCAVLALSFFVVIGTASAQTVRDIRVEGTQRVEPATVLSYMSVRPGDPLNQDALDRSLKSLFATGLFVDVNLRAEGDVVVVSVVENPVINEIAFEGNERIK